MITGTEQRIEAALKKNAEEIRRLKGRITALEVRGENRFDVPWRKRVKGKFTPSNEMEYLLDAACGADDDKGTSVMEVMKGEKG